MTADRQLRLSLYWRMLVALTVLTVVSLLVAATAVLVGGLVAWLGLIVISYVLETLFLPFAGEPYSVVGWILRSPLRVAVLAGIALLPLLHYRPVRDEIRAFRTELGKAGEPATETHPELATGNSG